MPNRILKDSICRSESVAQLGWFDQCVFTRLIVLADDYGRYDARPKIIKGSGFPLQDDVTAEDIQTALENIQRTGMIRMYEVKDHKYLEFTSWKHHQNIRNQKSKYPSPDIDLNAIDNNCEQLSSSAGKCARNPNPNPNPNPIQSESNPNPDENPNPNPYPNSNPNPIGEEEKDEDARVEKDFKLFWDVYPVHRGRTRALNAFKAVSEPVETLITALERQKRTTNWKKDNGKWIPAPDNWLKDERWKDDIRDSDIAPETATDIYGEAEPPW